MQHTNKQISSLCDPYRFDKDEDETNVFRALRYIPWINQYVDDIEARNILQEQWKMYREDARFGFDQHDHLSLQYLDRPVENGHIISKGLRALRWWTNNAGLLSILSKVAIRTIKTSIGSSECERKFSVYATISKDDELQATSTETKKILAMLKMNKHLL